MRDPLAGFDDFYGDLDCHRGEEKIALRLKVLETGRNVCFGGKGGGSAPSPDPAIGQAALKQAETGQDWLSFARDQFDVGNERQGGIDALSNRLTEKQIETIDRSNQWAQEDRNIQADYRNKYDQWADQDRAVGIGYREDFAQTGREALAAGQKYSDQFADAGENALILGKQYADEFGRQGQAALAAGQRYQGIFDEQANNQYGFAKEQQDRYKNTYQPMEEQFAQDAKNWDSADRQSKVAAEARADVLTSAAGAQQQQQRQLASMGVDPRSGKFAAASNATGLQAALSAAGAQNAARDNVRTQGMALRGTAIDMGRGVQAMGQQASQLGMQASGAANAALNTGMNMNMQATSAGLGAMQNAQSMNLQAKGASHSALSQGQNMSMQANNLGLAASGVGNTAASLGMGNQGGGYTGLGLGVNAGQAAMNTTLGANSAFQQNGQNMNAGFSGAMQGYAGQASTLNSLYGNQLQAWSTQKQADAQATGGMFGGIGSLLGTGIGAYAALSSKKAKENKRPVKGALNAVEKMPVEKWKYKDGMADGGEHVGPYAEDFKKATGLGDGKSINLVDAIGINMKATQELSAKVDKLVSAKTPAKARRNPQAATA